MYIEIKKLHLRVNLFVPVGAAIVFMLNGFLPSMVMLLAAVFHEAGHILFAKAVNAPVKRFDIELWGGRMYYGGMLGYRQELFISAGGIAANVLTAPLGLVSFFGVYGKLFFYSSFCYALVNSIPAKTLDGGELMRCVLRLCGEPWHAERAERAVHLLSVLFIATAGLMLCMLTGFNSSVMFAVLISVVVLATEIKKE